MEGEHVSESNKPALASAKHEFAGTTSMPASVKCAAEGTTPSWVGEKRASERSAPTLVGGTRCSEGRVDIQFSAPLLSLSPQTLIGRIPLGFVPDIPVPD